MYAEQAVLCVLTSMPMLHLMLMLLACTLKTLFLLLLVCSTVKQSQCSYQILSQSAAVPQSIFSHCVLLRLSCLLKQCDLVIAGAS